MPTALDVTPEEMAVYRATARRRWEREQQELARRRERAWELARRAARLLKEEFGVSRVVAFGSVARGAPFHAHSAAMMAIWTELLSICTDSTAAWSESSRTSLGGSVRRPATASRPRKIEKIQLRACYEAGVRDLGAFAGFLEELARASRAGENE